MSGYNVRLVRFTDNEYQLRLYSNVINRSDGLSEEQREVLEDIKALKDEIAFYEDSNPFDRGAREFVELKERTQEDIDRSFANSMNRTIHKIYEYSRSNVWEWFFTFTFDDSVDRYDYEACRRKISKFLNNTKTRLAPDLKYLLVPELHLKGKKNSSGKYAWHFHALISNIGALKLTPAINNKKTYEGKPNIYYKKPLLTYYPDGDPIYNVDSYNLGFSTATRVKDSSKASKYIVKYMTKECCKELPNKQRFTPSRNLDLPRKELYFETCLVNGNIEEVIDRFCSELKTKVTWVKNTQVTNGSYTNDITYLELKKE